MSTSYVEIDQKPFKIAPKHINFGLAVDITKKDGSHSLVVPNIKQVDQQNFNRFFSSYNELLRKVKMNEIEPEQYMVLGCNLSG